MQLTDLENGVRALSTPAELVKIVELQESASKWNRQKWEAEVRKCLEDFTRGQVDILVFPRVDRESRFLAGSYPVLLDLIKAGMPVYFAEERLLLDNNKENRDNFEEYQRLVTEAQAYIRVFRRNTMGGRQRAAIKGKIPSGFGPHQGYLGLKYDGDKKMLLHTPQIQVAKEILQRCLDGETSSHIAKDMATRGIRGVGGNIIKRSGVCQVLAKARVYAGEFVWNGIALPDRVESPIITPEEAAAIKARLKLNKEQSYGFGKRKWLTGRVFCGTCGRRYALVSNSPCKCNGADWRLPTRCPAPQMPLKQLSSLVWTSIAQTMAHPSVMLQVAHEAHKAWEARCREAEELQAGLARANEELGRRRRMLSYQHEIGGLTNEEYKDRLSQLTREAQGQPNVAPFLEPEPPSPDEIVANIDLVDKAFKRYQQCMERESEVLQNPQDSQALEIAEKLDVKVIVRPPEQVGEKYSLSIFYELLTITEEHDVSVPDRDETETMVLASSTRFDPIMLSDISHQFLRLECL
jgi:hypothetical protein